MNANILDIRTDSQGEPVKIFKESLKSPFFCKNSRGTLSVFKKCILEDKETIYELVAPHIMKKFNVPTITYNVAPGNIKGQEVLGLVSEYVEHTTLEDSPEILHHINNPDESVRGMIFDAWIGNFDRIVTNSNVWVQSDGKVIFGDYGCAFRKGITVFGLPKANLVFMKTYGRKEIIENSIKEIILLSNEDIINIINDVFINIPIINDKIKTYIINLLITNRDEFKVINPFNAFYSKKEPLKIRLKKEEVKEIGEAILTNNGDIIFSVEQFLKKLCFYNNPVFEAVLKRLFNILEEICNNHINNENKPVDIILDETEVFMILQNPYLMKELKHWLRNEIHDIIAPLF